MGRQMCDAIALHCSIVAKMLASYICLALTGKLCSKVSKAFITAWLSSTTLSGRKAKVSAGETPVTPAGVPSAPPSKR